LHNVGPQSARTTKLSFRKRNSFLVEKVHLIAM